MKQAIINNAITYHKLYHGHLFENVLPFWMQSDLLDKTHGGYITSVDRQGKSYNDDKSVWFQGRGLWTFSALCNRYGMQEEWIEAAQSGKKFLEDHCFDSDGRMFFQVTREGNPLRKRRYMFSESFYVVGMAEYGAAMEDKDALEKARICFDRMLTYYRNPEKDPFKITPKAYTDIYNESSAAVPMVLVSCAQVLRRCDPDNAIHYSDVVKEIVNAIITNHYQPELQCVLENVLPDGSHRDNPAGRTINPGHSCENAWFLMNEAVYSNNEGLLQKALNILDWSLDRGWDNEFGGILYFVDVDNKPCEALEWDMKLWWVHNEALISTLMAYGLTGDEKYWNWFEKIHEYAFSHFPDVEYGEWYGYLHRDGTVSHTQKGSMWKGPYHLPRCLMICEELLEKIAEEKKITPVL